MFEEQQQEQLCFIEDETRASFSNVHHLLSLLGERIDLPSFISVFFPPCSAADQFIANSKV